MGRWSKNIKRFYCIHLDNIDNDCDFLNCPKYYYSNEYEDYKHKCTYRRNKRDNKDRF